MRRGWTTLWVGLVSATCGGDAFVCEGDPDCGTDGGQCELSGFCSFPDPSCDSGRKYGEHAGDLSGHCVPARDETSGGGSTTTATNVGPGSSGASVGTSTTANATADGSTGPALTSGVDASTTADTSGTSTTGQMWLGLCDADPIVEEGFDALPLSAAVWLRMLDADAMTMIVDGQLQVGIDLPDAASPAAYWEIQATPDVPVSGRVGVEVLSTPAPGVPGEIYVGLVEAGGAPPVQLYLDLLDDGLYAERRNADGTYDVLGFLAYDPVDDRWLRLSFDSVTSTADFETSPDGVMWTAFHTESVPGFAFDGARAIYGAGVWEGPYVDDAFAVVDNAFMCG